MNNYQCKQYIHHLYGLYVYLTYVHICIHVEISISYLSIHRNIISLPKRVTNSFLRQTNKTIKSLENNSSTSQHIVESHPISRDITPSSN